MYFLTRVAQRARFSNILDKYEQEEHLFQAHFALQPRLREKFSRQPERHFAATKKQSGAAKPVNMWQLSLKFILAKGSPC